MIRDIQVSFQSLVYDCGFSQEIVKKANQTTDKDVDLFLRLLLESKEKIGGKIMKVNIDLTLNQKQIDFRCSDSVYDVCSVFLEFPFKKVEDYLALSSTEKSELILKYILIGFEELSKKTDTIDMNLIRSFAKKCRELEYKNHYYFFPAKSSKNRKHKAGIWVEHEMEVFRIYLDVLDKNKNLLVRELVAETEPGYPKFYPLLGGLKWIDNETVEMFNRKREVIFTYKIS